MKDPKFKFDEFLAVYEEYKNLHGAYVYKHIKAILVETQKRHHKFLVVNYPNKDAGQSWRSIKGKISRN